MISDNIIRSAHACYLLVLAMGHENSVNVNYRCLIGIALSTGDFWLYMQCPDVFRKFLFDFDLGDSCKQRELMCGIFLDIKI